MKPNTLNYNNYLKKKKKLCNNVYLNAKTQLRNIKHILKVISMLLKCNLNMKNKLRISNKNYMNNKYNFNMKKNY